MAGFFKRTQFQVDKTRIKLSEYDFDIEYVKGKDNKVADFLSRLELDEDQEHVDDDDDDDSPTEDSMHIINYQRVYC